MRKLLAAAMLTLSSVASAAGPISRSVGNAVLEDVPEIPAALAEKLQRYQNTRSADLVGFDWGGSGVFIRTRFGDTPQLHAVKRPGGDRRQLTFLAEPVRTAVVRPVKGGGEIAYLTDKGGAENFQVYLFRAKDGSSTLLTDGKKSQNQAPLWSRDGGQLAYTGTARNGRDFDLYVYDAAEGTSRRVADLAGQWFVQDWSPDGRKVLVLNLVSVAESYPHLVDVATGKLEPLFPGQETRKVAYGGFSGILRFVDRDRLLFASDEGSEYQRLGVLELKTRKTRWLTTDRRWDVEGLAVSLDGRRAAVVFNEDGVSRLYTGAPTGPFRPAAGVPRGWIRTVAFSPDGEQLGFTATTPSTPGDVFVMDWKTRRVERWTDSETGGIAKERFVEPSLFRFPTFDQVDGKPRMIPAFYYKPKGDGPFPVVVSIHGGPEGQERPWFNPVYQAWVNELGIAVLVPNVRGSTGYGKAYTALDNGRLREDSVKDIGALLDWTAGRPELDAKRIAVYGGSYGGYMVLATMAMFGERIKAAIDVVGISNFVTFLKNTADYRRDLRRAEYGDERDPAMAAHLEAISPTTLSSKLVSPLFVAQGANDPRVPASEAAQIVKAVRKNGRKAWYFLAKDEGHGFAKKANRDLFDPAAALFWQTHLLPTPPAGQL